MIRDSRLAVSLNAEATIQRLPATRVFHCECIEYSNRYQRKAVIMTHVVTEPCSGCKYTDCVVVCPVECFYEGDQMVYIHPEECIDCEACVPECPVEAIFHEDNIPEEWKSYIELNAEKSESDECDVITEKKEPLAEE